MTSLAQVFRVIATLKEQGVIEDYAVGGAMAALFYAEPLRTYDLDVFVLLPPASGKIVRLNSVYEWLAGRGFHPDAEHVLVHGVPVQFLPAYNELVDEAIAAARALEYEAGVVVRVVGPEHLIALAVQAGGRKRREHVARLLEAGNVDRDRLQVILTQHRLLDEWRARWEPADG